MIHKNLIRTLIFYGIKLFHFIFTYSRIRLIKSKFNTLHSIWIGFEFKEIGKNSYIGSNCELMGGQYISIGNNTRIGNNVIIEVWDKYLEDSFIPEINIGNNSSIGDNSHISCINSIYIGNGVRMGRKIFITDNAHGVSARELLEIPPNHRPLYSKGKVIIEDNVWIGEKVSILPGVTIGRGAIIGANAVVTKNIPAYTLAGGIPAKIIKTIK